MHVLLNIFLLAAILITLNAEIENDEIGSCTYGRSENSVCAGSCNVKNSKCETIIDTDMLYCGCTYCNYDSNANKCAGKCQNRQTGQCISRIREPKTDSDCGCFSCSSSKGENGEIICSGTCFESGMSCQVANVSAYNLLGYNTECLCQ